MLKLRWEVLYWAAISATNTPDADERIRDAEAAIFARLNEIGPRGGIEIEVEREALGDALYALRGCESVSHDNLA